MDATTAVGPCDLCKLPEEVLLLALSFLDEKELVMVSLLCKQFLRLAEDDALWRSLFRKRWQWITSSEGERSDRRKRRRRGWRELFIRRSAVAGNWKKGKYTVRTLQGHENQLYCLQYDDQKIVSGSEDETIRVWDIESGKCQSIFKGHTSGVWCLQFIHERLITGSEDSAIKIWNLDAGECVHTLTGHKYGIWSLQFDETTLVSGAEDHTVKIWDLCTLQTVQTLVGHNSDIWCLQFNQAYNLIVSGSGYEDKSIRLWDMRSGKTVLSLHGHEGAVNSVAVHFEANQVLSGSADHTIKIWDIRDGEGCCQGTLSGHKGEVLCLRSNSPLNPKMVSGGGSMDKCIKVWEGWRGMSKMMDGGPQLTLSLEGHTSGVWGLQYDDDKIVSGSADKLIRIWNFSGLDQEKAQEEGQNEKEA